MEDFDFSTKPAKNSDPHQEDIEIPVLEQEREDITNKQERILQITSKEKIEFEKMKQAAQSYMERIKADHKSALEKRLKESRETDLNNQVDYSTISPEERKEIVINYVKTLKDKSNEYLIEFLSK